VACRSIGCVAYMHSRPLTRGSLLAQAQVVLLAIAAIGSPACEIVSGLNRLEPVDCLSCDSALRGDSSADASVSDARMSDAGVLDGSSERKPGESGPDAGEPDVLGSDTGDFDDPRSDADADHSDADSRCSDADSDCGPCLYVHANGLGQNFFDCTPLGTHNAAQAMEACVAYTGNSLQCRAAMCGDTPVVCSSESATSCACWAFLGAGAGHVKDSLQAGALNCMCPGPTAPTWN
jgi:hypothetical protein